MQLQARLVPLLTCMLLAPGCGAGDLTLPSESTPATLTIVAGDGQAALAGALLSDPLVVAVADGLGRPISGAQVEFRFVVDLPGAEVTPGSAPTDELGQAEVRARLGQQEGQQPVEAVVVVPGEDLRVHFGLTALAKDGGGGGPPSDGGGGSAGGGDDGAGGGGGGPPGPPHDGGGKGGGHGHDKGDKDQHGGHDHHDKHQDKDKGKGHDKD
jgi:hypothetical protein